MPKTIAIYVAKRVAILPLIIFAIISINFLLIHLAPGGPFTILLSSPGFTPQDVYRLEAQYGLNKPLYEQFFIYIFQTFTGNLGISYFYGVPVINVILAYLPNTLVLAGLSLIFSSIIGIVFGILATMYKKIDNILSVSAIVSYTTPVFWQGILLILIFSVYLKFFPSTGVYFSLGGFSLISYLSHIILPVISLSLLLFPPIFFFTRGNIIAIMKKDFIKALYSKGLKNRSVFIRHGLKNALLPVITLIGLHSTILFGGATIVEIVFTWPGIGLLTYTAILNKDYPLLLGSILFYGILVSLLNLIFDLVYLVIDPRIKLT